MPKPSLKYHSILSSPRGIEEDRNAVHAAVDEVNRYLEGSGIEVKLDDYDFDVRPTVGLDGQDVVNKQIVNPSDFGIFLVHDRIGSPTPRAPSGTIEEARRLIARRKDGENIDIMFFFRRPHVHISDTVLDELKKVVEFRKELEQEGVFWKEYESTEDLSKLIRIHLPIAIRELHKNNSASLEAKFVDKSVADDLRDGLVQVDGPGILDLEIEFSDGSSEFVAAMTRVAEASNRMTEGLKAEVKKLGEVAKQPVRDPRAIKAAVNGAVDAMEIYNNVLENEIPRIRGSGNQITYSMTSIVGMSGADMKTSSEELLTLASIIDGTLEQAAFAISAIGEQRVAVSALPQITKELGRERRRAIALIDELVEAFEKFSGEMSEVRSAATARAAQLNAGELGD